MSTNTCLPRSYCYDTSNPEYYTMECSGVRGTNSGTGSYSSGTSGSGSYSDTTYSSSTTYTNSTYSTYSGTQYTTTSSVTVQCNWTTEYYRMSDGTCQPRTNCFDPSNAEYTSMECSGVRSSGSYYTTYPTTTTATSTTSSGSGNTTYNSQTMQCNWQTEYYKMSNGTCQPRTNCFDTSNPEYTSTECVGVRGMGTYDSSTTTYSMTEVPGTYSDINAPSTPTNFSFGDVTTGGFKLYWRHSSDPVISGRTTSGIAGYKIFKNDESAFTYFTKDNYYAVTGLQPATSYKYTILAVDKAGNASARTLPLYVGTEGAPNYYKASSTINSVATSSYSAVATTSYGSMTYRCDWTTQYLKMSTNECLPRSYCYDTANSEYVSAECGGVRGATNYATTTFTAKISTSTITAPPSVSTSSVRTITPVYATTSLAVNEIYELHTGLDNLANTIAEQRMKIISIINNRLGDSTSTEAMSIRASIMADFDRAFLGTTTVNTEAIERLTEEIYKRLEGWNGGEPIPQLSEALGDLKTAIDAESMSLKKLGVDELYKDTNSDGISDYESVKLYGLDPVKPSPVTEYEGKQITAGEKALLGFDPAQKELVKVVPQEPVASVIPPTPVYKVEEVALTEEKKVTFKGQAMPNSIITLYIYSTPIIVTVKTDANGQWQYTLDKELDSGEHKIYTASVDNSGKIVAKSQEFTFVKTAEAAALGELIAPQNREVSKPSLMGSSYFYYSGAVLVGLLLLAILAISLTSRNRTQ